MINVEGWILLYRKLLTSDMWKALTSMQRDLLIACLLKANHKPAQWEYKKEIYECEPGEFITSIENLRVLCAKGTTTKMVRTGLKKLQNWDFLAYEGAKTGTKVCIVNWGVYQNLGTPKGVPSGKLGATSGQHKGTMGATKKKNQQRLENDEQSPHQIFEIDLKTEFDKIYAIYPNKDSKNKAYEAFCNMELDGEIIAKIHAVINYSKKNNNTWNNKQYIPKLVNWLSDKRYLDDVPIDVVKKAQNQQMVVITDKIECKKHGIQKVRVFKRGNIVVDRDDCPMCVANKEAV